MKKVIAALLVLIMVVSVFPVAEMQAMASAITSEAERAEVLNSKAGLHKSGNWLYSVMRHDIAAIEGYEGDAASLRIPVELDGYPVGAIADNALADQVHLTSVTIPTQVFSIGENAFANPSALTVTGYDGSAALAWAEKNGAVVRSLTDMYLNEGIVDLSGVGSAAKVNEDQTLSVNAALSFVMDEGTVFFFTATDKYGMNFWGGQVTGVKRENGSATVSYVTVDKNILIDKIVASSDMEEIRYEFIPDAGLTCFEDDSVEATDIDYDIGLWGDIYAKVWGDKTCKLIDNKVINVFGIPVTINSTFFLDFDFMYDLEVFATDKLSADFTGTITTTIKAHEEAHWKKTLRLGEVTVYGVKGFQIYVPIDLVVTADGSVDIDIKHVATLTWNYDSTKNKSVPKPVLVNEMPKNDIIFTGNASLGLKVGIAIEACDEDVAYLGVEGGVKIYAKLTLPRSCLDLQAYLYGEAEIEVILLGSKTFPFYDEPLFVKHYELESISPLVASQISPCTRGDKTIRFQLNGGEEMNAFKERKVAWNSVFMISDPTRAGYNFMGWYTDEQLTNRWTVGSTIREDTTLYAKWERKYVPVKSIAITNGPLEVYTSGQTRTKALKVSVTPSDATNTSVNWISSDRGIASVDANGNVTGIAPGETTIKAVSNDNKNIISTCKVTVKQYVNEIKVGAAQGTIIKGNTTTVSASVAPATANDKGYTWSSSNTNVAQVDAAGKVTAINPGEVNIIATAKDGSGVKGQVTIKVLPIPVESVTLNLSTGEVYTSGSAQTLQLTATVLPANAGDRSLRWSSSDKNIAIVDEQGKVSGKSAGKCVITAQSVSNPAITAQFVCEVKQLVNHLSVSPSRAEMDPGQSVQFAVKVAPDDATNKAVRWVSSNSRVARVDGQGHVTAVSGGDAVISAVSLDGSSVIGQGRVHVSGAVVTPVKPDVSVAVSSVALDFGAIKVFTSGESNSIQLSATVSPANAGNPAVLWSSSNTAVVTVDNTGMVTGVKGGTAVITATSAANQALYAVCNVTVEQLIDTITLNAETAEIFKGEQYQLTATILPVSQAGKAVRWYSSDPAIAKVDHLGLVNAVGVGKATITASALDGSTASDTFVLTVKPVPVASVKLDTAAEVVYTSGKQHTVQVAATVAPETAEDRSLTWSSSNPAVATVDAQGNVTGLKTGVAVITAKSNSNPDKMAQCTITVKKWVTGVEIQAERKVMAPEETLQLQAVVTPGDATERTVAWKSSNPNVISVSGNGLLTAYAPGTVVIQAAAVDGSGIVSQVEMTVTENPVYDIKLSDEEIVLYTSGDQRAYQLTCELLPVRASYRSVTWYSEDNNIAYVDGAGRVIGISAGTVVVGVQSDSNPEVTAECRVIVRQMVESVQIMTETTSLSEGEKIQMTADVGPGDATDRSVVWRSSNPQVATVSSTGVVQAVAPGTAVISAEAKDGSGKAGSVEITVEKWLSISGEVPDQKLYLNGKKQMVLGEILLTRDTVQRLAQSGLQPEWVLTGGGKHTAVTLTTRPLQYWLGEGTAEYACALLALEDLLSSGTDTYTLTCKAGEYSASLTFKLTCAQEMAPGNVSIGFSDVTVSAGEKVLIPAIPTAAEGAGMPADMQLTLVGDDLAKATVVSQADGTGVSFTESSIYTVTAHYSASNVDYAIEVTIRVKGADGMVKLPVREVKMSAEACTLVPGEELQLKAEGFYGSEAVDCGFTWASSDQQVASVDQNGKVIAQGVGVAVIDAYAAQGNAYGSCLVSVEKALDFTIDEVTEVVYIGGQEDVDIANVVITRSSAARLEEMALLPEWKLEKVSGSSVELAVQELNYHAAEEGSAVRGSLISLVRIYGTGETVYNLTCQAGMHQTSIPVIIRVVAPEKALPQNVQLKTKDYSTVVGENVRLETAVTVEPAAAGLPADTQVQFVMQGAVGNAVTDVSYADGYVDMSFGRSGVFKGNLEFYGSNYSYLVPFSVTVADENGHVAKLVEQVIVSPEDGFLMVGETVKLSAEVLPAQADDKTVQWMSYDDTVASVSADGTVKAVGAGRAIIHATSPETGVFGECVIYVENGLSMERSSDTVNVYLEGLTRTKLDTYYLSYASSLRVAGEEPTWKLTRVKGSCLTLSVTPTEETTSTGVVRYGADVSLHSVTRTGTAEYDLTCTVGGESATTRITVHALERTGNLPDHITFVETDYYAGEGELIVVEPELVSVPAEVPLPADLRLSIGLDANGAAVVNEKDYFVSRARSTISFDRAGTYHANFVYSCSNATYSIPVVFHIADQTGHVPVFVSKLSCDPGALYMEAGDMTRLQPVFSPANATVQQVQYTSTNPKVATVTADGVVTAVANGYAQIVLTPADGHVPAATCNVTVEEGFSINGATSARTLYLQGVQAQNLTSYLISEGTGQRMAAKGLTPRWDVTRKSGNAATYGVILSEDQRQLTLVTESLMRAGTDVYTITCTAGDYRWSKDFTLKVVDLGQMLPKVVTAAQSSVTMAVGQTKTIDMSPVCQPAGTLLPETLTDNAMFTGIGTFYDALDFDVYDEYGDQVTVAFTEPGTYLLVRSWSDLNLQYNALCVIHVTGSTEETKSPLLKVSDTECIVYAGGKSTVAFEAEINDWFAYEAFQNDISWQLERISGSAVTASLVNDGIATGLYIANVKQQGTDVWRLTCTMGDYSESVDVTVHAIVPRAEVPHSISLAEDAFQAMAGEWVYVPFSVTATPGHAKLPDAGADFWRLEMQDKEANQLVETMKNDTGIMIRFREIGAYSAVLRYESGNVAYSVPVYFYITDEAGQLPDAQLKLTGHTLTEKVWLDGLTNVSIATLQLADSDNGVASGAAAAMVKNHGAEWTVRIVSGASNGQLSIEETVPGQAKLVLDGLTSVGSIKYEVSCKVQGKTYTYASTIEVVDQSVPKPVLHIGRSTYTLTVGETAVIDRRILNADTGIQLASATDENWQNAAAIAAMGYGYETHDDTWYATFYEKGVYRTVVQITVGNLSYSLPLNFTVLAQNEAEEKFTLRMPGALVEIEDEAMLGLSANRIDLRGSNVTRIGSRAFGDNAELEMAYLPASIQFVADDAFQGSDYVVILCPKGSYAEKWATENGFAVEYIHQ